MMLLSNVAIMWMVQASFALPVQLNSQILQAIEKVSYPKVASKSKYPWIVALQSYEIEDSVNYYDENGFFCYGALIAPNVVLTAGDCVAEYMGNGEDITVFIKGSSQYQEGSEERSVAILHLSPDKRLGMITLSEASKYDPVPLYFTTVKKKKRVWNSGWGFDSEVESVSKYDKLHETPMKVDFKTFEDDLFEGTFFADGYGLGTGSPYLYKNKLVGINLGIKEDNLESYPIHDHWIESSRTRNTFIKPFEDWIDETLHYDVYKVGDGFCRDRFGSTGHFTTPYTKKSPAKYEYYCKEKCRATEPCLGYEYHNTGKNKGMCELHFDFPMDVKKNKNAGCYVERHKVDCRYTILETGLCRDKDDTQGDYDTVCSTKKGNPCHLFRCMQKCSDSNKGCVGIEYWYDREDRTGNCELHYKTLTHTKPQDGSLCYVVDESGCELD